MVCERKGIPYEEGKPVEWSSVRRYNPATAAKYADAITRLKEGGLTTAKVAAEFGLHPECFRQYLKEHEPELYARQGMVKIQGGFAPLCYDNRKREIAGKTIRVQRLLLRPVHPKTFPRPARTTPKTGATDEKD